jgi:hypothetical protein
LPVARTLGAELCGFGLVYAGFLINRQRPGDSRKS